MKRILRAAMVVGMSSLVVVALGALRHKFIAVGAGAEGVGALGILASTANLGVVVFSVGLNTSGVQSVAAAMRDGDALARVRAGLLRGSVWLATLGGIVAVAAGLVWSAIQPGGAFDPVIAVALGITLSSMVLSGAQLALLNGMGRVGLLAVCNSIGAVVGTIATIIALQFSGQAGIVAALAAAPLATAVCSAWFVLRSRDRSQHVPTRVWISEFRGMASLGGMVMLGLIATSATQLGVRLWIEGRHGIAAAGQFQAVWTITTLYIGFVLSALAAEYFPRISAEAGDRRRLNRSVDVQVRVALLLAWPVLLWLIVLARFVLELLYSAEFDAATGLLRWQLVGDVLKIVGWAIAFLLLARKARVSFFIGEIMFNAAYLLGVVVLPGDGLSRLGIAYGCAYGVYVAVLLVLAFRETGFRLSARTFLLLTMVLLLAVGTAWAMEAGSAAGAYIAAGLAAVATVVSVCLLQMMRVRERREERSQLADQRSSPTVDRLG